MRSIHPALAVALMTACAPTHAADPPPFAAKVGVELDGLGDGGRARPFVDLAKTLRPWTRPGSGDPAPTDAHGWPTADAATVLFDIRPFAAWFGTIDDPDPFVPDWGGTYPFTLEGRAEVAIQEGPGCFVEGVAYDPARNATSGRIVVPSGTGILVVAFTRTRRTADAPEGTGFTGLRVIRPGYPADTTQVFTTEFLRSLRPFAVLRYMDWLDTNHQPGYYGDAGHHALEWSRRRRPDDGTQVATGETYGVAWEYVAALANATGKDAWINVPVAATDDYVRELARFLHRELKPGLNLYIEHSNEVWNFGFPQYIYNKLAAIEEVKAGGSPLNDDGSTDEEAWARRRHAKRVVDIGRIFREEFGPAGRDRIRPVYASWVISPGPHFAEALEWVERTNGPPADHFYGIAGAAYYNVEKAGPDASPEQLLEAMQAASDANLRLRAEIQGVADRYRLKHCQYEVGPDVGGGKVENVANRLRANRLPGIRDVMLRDAREHWFDRGGDLYMIFAHCGSYSRYGAWGLSDDISRLETPKWRAVYELTGTGPPRD